MQNKYPEFVKDNPFASQAKLLCHMDRLNEYFTTGDTTPIFMEINLNDFCNLKCKWCISENIPKNTELNFDSAVKYFKDFKVLGGKAVTFSGGGEPTTHTKFKELVHSAKDAGLELGLMTNGVFNHNKVELIADNFEWVRVSLDTVNKIKYEAWKGVDAVDIVIRNIKSMNALGLKVGVNCNISNDYSVEDVEELISTIKNHCNYIQFRPVLPRYFKNETIEINTEVWNYLKEYYSNSPNINFSFDKLNDMSGNNLFPFTSCEGHFFSPILNANGDVCVCMYHLGDSDYVFGNINDNSFIDVWNSEKRKEIIQKVRTVDYKNKCQVCCKLTEINKLVEFFSKKEIDDINFL